MEDEDGYHFVDSPWEPKGYMSSGQWLVCSKFPPNLTLRFANVEEIPKKIPA